MLKKVICESPRLAALKNDTYRLLYTWLIPHLDVEGRFSADIRILKSHICPILDNISHQIIRNALADMEQNDLISLYEVNGRPFLELKRFHKHQTLREGREKPSEIPASSVGTPSVLRRSSVDTAQQAKLREEKRREAKGPDTKQPVDNSAVIEEEPPPFDLPNPKPESPKKEPSEEKAKPKNTHGERWSKKHRDDLKTIMEDIRTRYGLSYHQKVYVFVQSNFNNRNPDAIVHALNRLVADRLAGKPIPMPGPWLEAVLNGNGKHPGENGRFEARESERAHEELKQEEIRDVARLVGGIGKMPL